ncbi:hypothetical protein OPT61_g5891 [Boeremia exigua]|uniref:Uncharacterized protein n=1 Tax=Boeremia exigua TaxID=749465 RepID=A0ACC2I8R2_9PLEO|nr:hypothetical protein OPT61_g5891 [Boeremia exigua]
MVTANAAASCYHGQSLKPSEIRLLTIEEVDGSLRLQAKPHSLLDIIDYDAISYVWGTAAASVKVSCNGGELVITPTAYEMLQNLYLHRPDRSRALWIDAICINQQDPDEKAIQVPLMHQIYTQATNVIVWMGALTAPRGAFMTEFPRVAELARAWVLSQDQAVVDMRAWPARDSEFWLGFYDVLDNDWFRRLWTFQEVILAPKAVLLCGSSWIDLDSFVEFTVDGHFGAAGAYITSVTHVLANHPGRFRPVSLPWEECRTIQRYREVIYDNSFVQDGNIPVLVNTLRLRKGKEPVDRIWAIAGLLEGTVQSDLAPFVDYSETGRREYWRTYVQFAKALVHRSQSLGLLCVPPSVEAKDDNVPSWCPDLAGHPACSLVITDFWNYPLRDSGLPARENLHLDPDDEERSIARGRAVLWHPLKLISFSEADELLHARGFVVDTITEVIEDPLLLGATEYTANSEWSTMSLDNPVHVANIKWHERSLDLARRITYGKAEEVSAIPAEYLMAYFADCRISKDAETAYRDAIAMITSCDSGKVTNLEQGRRRRAYECIGTAKGKVGHTFFGTQGGRFGTSTPGCKKGDKICVLYGGHPLYALRWPESADMAGSEEEPARFCSIAFIPHLMEPHQSDAARIGPDRMFAVR